MIYFRLNKRRKLVKFSIFWSDKNIGSNESEQRGVLLNNLCRNTVTRQMLVGERSLKARDLRALRWTMLVYGGTYVEDKSPPRLQCLPTSVVRLLHQHVFSILDLTGFPTVELTSATRYLDLLVSFIAKVGLQTTVEREHNYLQS